jgi:hypothetical protein
MLAEKQMNLENFFYLRHGQSEANLAGLMCGRNCDSPLTSLGREQAQLAAETASESVDSTTIGVKTHDMPCPSPWRGAALGRGPRTVQIFGISRVGPENVRAGGSRKLPLVYHLQTV